MAVVRCNGMRAVTAPVACPDFLRNPITDVAEAHVRLIAAEAIVHAFAVVGEIDGTVLTWLHEEGLRGASKAMSHPDNDGEMVFQEAVARVVTAIRKEAGAMLRKRS